MNWSSRPKQKDKDRNRLRRVIVLSRLDEIVLCADQLQETLSALDSVGIKYELDSNGNLFISK